MKPLFDTVLKEHDKVIAITKDDDTIILSDKENYEVNKDAITNPAKG
jgi:hypothetical protein